MTIGNKLRGEFNLIMSNVGKVKNYNEARDLRDAWIKWCTNLQYYIHQIEDEISLRLQSKEMSSDVRDYLTRQLRESVKITSRSLPLQQFESELRRKYSPETTKNEIFLIFSHKRNAWENTTRRHARKLWPIIDDVIDVLSRVRPFSAKDTTSIKTDIEGFSVNLVKFNGSDKIHLVMLNNLKRALQIYKKQAGKHFPWLIRNQLPIVVEHDPLEPGDAAAQYLFNKIEMYFWSLVHEDIRDVVRSLVHEMAHHFYRNYLSSDAKKAWNTFVGQRKIIINFDELIKKAHEVGSVVADTKFTNEFPLLAMQWDSLLVHQEYKRYNLLSIDFIKKYMEETGEKTAVVPNLLISAYASKNPEEAFCESIAFFIAYGPRRIPEEAIKFIKNISGNELRETRFKIRKIIKEIIKRGNHGN